jgi:acetyltransferase-like isoleucine patch superfamily enzyme
MFGPTAGAQSRVTVVTSLTERVAHRLRKHSVSSLILGALLRRKFTRAGLLVREPGLPRIRIRNLGGSIEADNCTFFPGVRLECWSGANIRIGNGTYLNRNVEIIAQREVVVGRDCQISWDVVIMDTDQHGFGGEPPTAHPVRLGDRVWVGCRAIILKGVTIGDDAVVAAGSVVTRDVAAGSVVAGVPARLIRMR